MRHDLQLRATARAIYDACYPGEEWAPTGFDEAERCRIIHYRQAVAAARAARLALGCMVEQLPLFATDVDGMMGLYDAPHHATRPAPDLL